MRDKNVFVALSLQEFDHPHILLQRENGFLRGMVEQTGKSMAEELATVAKNNYRPLNENQNSVEESNA